VLAAGCAGATNVASTAPLSARIADYARAVNMSASDVPGLRQTAAEAPEPPPTAQAAAFARCDGESSPALRVAAIASAEFSEGQAANRRSLHSVVEVLPSPAVAERNLAAFQGKLGASCYVRFVEAANRRRPGALRYGHTRMSPLPNPLAGEVPSFARRVTNILHGTGAGGRPIAITVYHDTYAFVQGSAEVALLASGSSSPVSLAAEQRLIELLYSRATVHHL